MKLKHLLTVIILIIAAHAFAQQPGRPVSGVVKDSTGTTIPGATIKLLTGTDSVTVATDLNGKFSFPAVPVNQFSLVVFSVG
ncbi:MAG TPA: carboxypeptidase-like regulatory domain-containing protein, partial [Mucilaginibacter sp.]